MENAVKAFYMVAALLIAIMILGLFIYLFRTGAIFGQNYDLRKEQEAINQFNAKFEVYATPIEKTAEGILFGGNSIFDVITASNLAYDINERNYNDNKNRVEVQIEGLKENLSIGIALNDDEQNVLRKGSFFKSKIDSITTETETILMDDILISPDIVNTGKLNDATLNLISGNGIPLNRIVYRYYFNCIVFYSEQSGKINKLMFTAEENEKFDEVQPDET